MRRALIDACPGQTRTAMLDGEGHLLDLLIQRSDKPDIVGGRYLGRVTAFDSGLQAAFVDIGLGRPGLLPKKATTARLNDGDAVVVEVVRAPSAGKGAKLAARAPESGEADGPAPRRLRAADPLTELLHRHRPDEIVVDGDGMISDLKSRVPELAEVVRGHPEPAPLFETADLEATIEDLLAPEVPLPGGGWLRIEPVTTLTAIDVDSGTRAARGGVRQLALETDLAAAGEIARQLRLRALSGLIVVDFLEIARRADRDSVAAALKDGVAGDPVATDIGPMRASGLVEISRARVRPPLHELLLERCGRDGSGHVKDPPTMAFEILRATAREAAATPGAALVVSAAPAVIAALSDGGVAAAARARTERRLGRALALRADPARPAESYEIERT